MLLRDEYAEDLRALNIVAKAAAEEPVTAVYAAFKKCEGVSG